MFALGLLITSVIGQQPTPPGVTFGNGIAGIPICDTGLVPYLALPSNWVPKQYSYFLSRFLILPPPPPPPPLFKKRSVVLNHTVSDGATHGVMHHFWTTGAEHIIDMIQMVSIWIPIVCTAITTHKYLIANVVCE